jgi:spermidine/putrescine ABC transporter ATP-binding subunit
VQSVAVELRNVVKRFGQVAAVDSLSLDVHRGEFLSLLGPSGCGKTTTLRIVAGFVEPDEGSILIDGQDVSELPPERRDIGMVFQNYALFPHMTVFDNVAYGLRRRKLPKRAIDERVARVLELGALSDLDRRYPRQLSGGQQQRVALARAVVVEPRVLLLDEPLSNLDAKLRKTMQIELRLLQRRLGITAIYVTHDQEEALTLSDRIVVLDRGRVMQIGTPQEIYERPANPFVVNFIGAVNVLAGRVTATDGDSWATLVTAGGLTLRARTDRPIREGEQINVAIRPEKIELLNGEAGSIPDVLVGTIEHLIYTGSTSTYHVMLSGGERITVEAQNLLGPTRHRPGDAVGVRLLPDNLFVMPA